MRLVILSEGSLKSPCHLERRISEVEIQGEYTKIQVPKSSCPSTALSITSLHLIDYQFIVILLIPALK